MSTSSDFSGASATPSLIIQWSLGQPYTADLRYLLDASRVSSPPVGIPLSPRPERQSLLERIDNQALLASGPSLLQVADWSRLARDNYEVAVMAFEGLLAKCPLGLVVAGDILPQTDRLSSAVGDAFYEAYTDAYEGLLTPPAVLQSWRRISTHRRGTDALLRLQTLWADLTDLLSHESAFPVLNALRANGQSLWSHARNEAMVTGLTRDDVLVWSVEEASADYLYLQWAAYADILRAADCPSGSAPGVLRRLAEADQKGSLVFTSAWRDVRVPADFIDPEIFEEWPLVPEDPAAENLRLARVEAVLKPVFAPATSTSDSVSAAAPEETA